jgi:hypothetical protein
VRVDEELKQKRAELLGEAEELAARIRAISAQVSAIDQVIAYAPQGSAAAKPQRPRGSQQPPAEFARINKSEAVLEVLREAGRPIGCQLSGPGRRGRIDPTQTEHPISRRDQGWPFQTLTTSGFWRSPVLRKVRRYDQK